MRIALPIGFGKETLVINSAYVNYIASAGYEPLLATPRNAAPDFAQICDGLLLPGGIDIDPIFYNEDNDSCEAADPIKDYFERQLLWAFADAGKPVFGICRGMQLIAREYIRRNNKKAMSDFEFFQNLNYHRTNSSMALSRKIPSHFVYCYTQDLYGKGKATVSRLPVNSMHHQALFCLLDHKEIKALGGTGFAPNFKLSAWTRRGLQKDSPGVIVEGFSIDAAFAGAPLMGVQWHPEELEDYNLLQSFFGMEAQAAELEA